MRVLFLGMSSALRLKQQEGISEHPLYASHATRDTWFNPTLALVS